MVEKRVTATGQPRYMARVFLGSMRRPSGAGSKRLEAHKTFRTLKDARRWEAEQRRARDTHTYVEPSKQRLGEFLTSWLDGAVRLSVRERTWASYAKIIRRVVGPASISSVPLSALRTAMLEQYYADLCDKGTAGRPLSARSVRYVHAILHSALAKARRDGAISSNPASGAKLPRQMRAPVNVLSVVQVQAFLSTSASFVYAKGSCHSGTLGNRWHALWHVLINGGLRPSEALGLRWEDVGNGSVHVRHSLVFLGKRGWRLEDPKTRKSERVVKLPRETMRVLDWHRAQQQIEREAAGRNYTDAGFVFTNARGGPADLRNITARHFVPLLLAAGLPRIRVYDLRHTHASIMLAAGVPVNVVAARLGHASAKMTLDVYAHILPGQTDATLAVYERYVSASSASVSLS